MTTAFHSRRFGVAALAAAGTVAASLAVVALMASSSPAHPVQPGVKPTVVLVHGAWADSSSWDAVVQRLQNDGYTVVAPANPLRSLSGDAAYISSVLVSISGPIVLVGHSYGGAVITNAATGNPNVKALVYINAFAPDQGESVLQLAGLNPGSELPSAITEVPYNDGSTNGTDVYIKTADFRAAFAADVPARQARLMAITQRPVTLTALTQPSGPPAWKAIPSWYLVGLQDEAIPPATQEFMAARAHSHTVEINSSHASLVSHPATVTNLILTAIHATT
jgi:pimeloyl-ACP methyl ester carboxylesterase